MPGRSRNIIEILIRSKADKKGFDKAEKELKGLGGAAKKAGGLLGGLDSQLAVLAGGAFAATGAIVAFKKAMDWGREGAIAAQTAQSFDLLLRKLDAAPDLLKDLQKASGGTVDDLKLMSSTATLLAGTSGELGRAMAGAAPELMNIAKAAQKLNPSLGDTTFLYQSLATGIKRSQPLILDNLGLTIKLGDANERMAQKLGKSVEALSAEEKQMALLEATLEAGSVMLDQVGGDTGSLTDDFERMDAAVKNAADALKMAFAPAMADVAAAIADTTPKIVTTITQLGLLTKGMWAWFQAAGEGADAEAAFNEAIAKGIGDTKTAARIRREAAWERVQAIQAEIDAMGEQDELFAALKGSAHEQMQADLELAQAAYALEISTVAVDDAMGGWMTTLGGVIPQLEDLGDETDDLARDNEALAKAVDLVRGRYEGFYSTLASGIVKFRDLGAAQAEAAEDYEDALADLKTTANDAYADIREKYENSLPDKTTIADRLGMAGDAWDEWALRLQDIINLGVASPWYQVLQDMGMEKPPDVGVKEWAEGLKDAFYKNELPELINQDAQVWKDHAAEVKTAQEAETAAVAAEQAKKKAILEKARQEQLAAEREARQRAMLELSLSLAEQTNQLQAWSEQKFGPDFSQVGDTAQEVLDLLDSGILEIDDSLRNLIANSAVGVQESLDLTGQAAEENKAALEAALDPESLEERAQQIKDTLDFADVMKPEEARAAMQELGIVIEEGLPDDPFATLSKSMSGATTSIIKDGQKLYKDLTGAADDIGNAWKKGMGEAKDAVEGVHEALKKLPKEITITVKTAIVGGAPGYQHGGQFTVEGPAGPDNVPVAFMATRGETVTVTPASMVPPGLHGKGSASAAGQVVSIGGDTYHITNNDRMAAAMVLADIEARRNARFGAYLGG